MIEGSWKRRSVTQSLTRQGPMARRIIESLRRLIAHGTSCNQDCLGQQLRINKFATTPFLSSLRDKGCRSFSPPIDFPHQLPRDLMQIINIQSMLKHRLLHQDYQGKSIGHICWQHVLGHRPLHQGYQGRHRPSTLLVLEHGPLRQGYQGQSIGHLSCTCWRIGPCIKIVRHDS